MDIFVRFLAFPLLVLWAPLNSAAVLVEFEATCNNDAPFVSGSTGNCALFGLTDTSIVFGSFAYANALYTPGSGISLETNQYDFSFEYGNQTFTEADNTLNLSFIVDSSGTSISSIAGVFVNAAGAQLSLLTPSTVRIRLGNEGADTFGEGAVWSVTAPTAIPLPASIWLFGSGMFFMALLRRRV